MAKKVDWIKTRDDDFFNQQGAYVDRVVANALAWGIPAPAVAALVTLRAEYEPLYTKVQDKKNRTGADVAAHRDCRNRFQTALRAFHKEWVVNNSLIPLADKVILVGKVRDTEPTPRGKIELVPYIFLKAIGGGVIEVRSQTEKDATRVSMLKTADGIECRWTLVPKGEMPPEGVDDAKKTVVSRKARFTIDCGDKNAGDSFYGFFRWVNQSIPANSGLWTKALRVVIA
ncbi:MAG: hypothetical protein V1871_00970 [Planctomycetota bacterium]